MRQQGPARTWRRPDELGDRVALHVLAHVQAQQGIWAAKVLVCQHLQGHTVCRWHALQQGCWVAPPVP